MACLGMVLGVLLLATACRKAVLAAKGFTEAKMVALPNGSSQQEVLGILGEPLDRWNHWDSGGKWDAALLVLPKEDDLHWDSPRGARFLARR